jgi:hypothetical protein
VTATERSREGEKEREKRVKVRDTKRKEWKEACCKINRGGRRKETVFNVGQTTCSKDENYLVSVDILCTMKTNT